MAGYSRMYVIGELGGFLGADGVNPIHMMILVGDADRQWLEPHYFDTSIKPIGRLRSIVPAEPNHPDSLLDALIAFWPSRFAGCASLSAIRSSLRDAESLDFTKGKEVPPEWEMLREQARPLLSRMRIWLADLVPIQRNGNESS